jgi:hypothetical protein
MVDRERTLWLAASFELDDVATIRREPYENGQHQTSSGKRNYSGLDLEKEISPPVEAELFS